MLSYIKLICMLKKLKNRKLLNDFVKNTFLIQMIKTIISVKY
jgi:hypothetical protein